MKLKEIEQAVKRAEVLNKEYAGLWDEHCAIQRLLSGDYTAERSRIDQRVSLSMIYMQDIGLINEMKKSLELFPVEPTEYYWNRIMLEESLEALKRLDEIETRLAEITDELESEV